MYRLKLHQGHRWTSKMCIAMVLSLLFCNALFAQSMSNTSQLESAYARLAAKVEATGDKSEKLSSVLSAIEVAISDLKQLQQQMGRLSNAASTQLLSDQQLSAELKKIKAKYPAPSSNASTNSVKTRLTQYQPEQDASLESLTSMNAQLSELIQRSESISSELVAARKRMDEAVIESSSGGNLDSNLAKARAIFSHASQMKATLKVKLLEKELKTLPLRQSQLEQRIKLENDRLNALTVSIDTIQSQLRQSDLRDAQRLTVKIEKRIQRAIAANNKEQLAEEQKNLALVNTLSALTTSYYREESLVQSTLNKTNQVETSLRLIHRIILAGRVGSDLGGILRRIRGELVPPVKIKRESARLRSVQIRLQLDSILWQDARDTTDTEVQQDTTINRLLFVERQQLLSALIDTANKLDNNLNSHLVGLEALNTKSAQLRRDLNGRLLWLPTNQTLNITWVNQTAVAFMAFLAPRHWQQVYHDFWSEFKASPVIATLLYLLGLGLLFYRQRFLAALLTLPKMVRNVNLDTHWVSPYGFLLSVSSALALPLILWATGWVLLTSHLSFTYAVGMAFCASAAVMFLLSSFIVLARPNGVIDAHFEWGEDARKSLASNLSWLRAIVVPATFVFAYAMTVGDAVSQYGLGRSVFLFISLAISYAGFRILKTGNQVAMQMFGRLPILGRVVFCVFVVVPLLLALLTLIGYFDTSVIVQEKLFLSGLLMLSGALIYSFMHRTHEVIARREAWSRAKVRRQDRLEKLSKESDGRDNGDALPNIKMEQFVRLEDVNKQTKTVIWLITLTTITTGLYFLWRSVLPALDITESVVLWQGVKVVNGVSTSQPISLSDVISALILIIGGFFMAKNLQGILSLSIPRKFKMRPGAEYAATKILGYIAVATGVVLGLSQLGLDWSKLQWIVAAMGVGLGFGLQEIVANFVSGLIILFERPIRVGDTVSIGNLDGVVTKISIRATTIKDYDKRDVLIPNKKIITDNVSNWTLNDSLTRILIKIGVGYKTDINLAKKLMLEAVTSLPDVLVDPAPSVYFVAHGDSTLDFEIRAYISDVSKRLMTKHAINHGAHLALTNAGINLAYPQRDIHIVSNVGSPVKAQ